MNHTFKPQVSNIQERNHGELTFVLSNIDVSFANALRRTMISDIPTVVFKTNLNENGTDFKVNTCRQNNEILKQRLECIPIHVLQPFEAPIQDWIVQVDVENKTDTILFVTTEDFKVINRKTGDPIRENLFPANEYGCYMDFARLQPKLSDTIPAEKLQFTATFSIGTAKENACYNVVSTCSYGCTLNQIAIQAEEEKINEELEKKNMSMEQKELFVSNWKHLEAKRIIQPNSFDFIVESVGVFSNQDIVKNACHLLADRLEQMETNVDSLEIHPSVSTIKNCFDIVLINEDYTLGKVIESFLYHTYYLGTQNITYIGFSKSHPHESNSLIRIGFKQNDINKATIKSQYMLPCFQYCKQIFLHISQQFGSYKYLSPRLHHLEINQIDSSFEYNNDNDDIDNEEQEQEQEQLERNSSSLPKIDEMEEEDD